MRLTALPVGLALTLACPAGALAQSWHDAYRRGDYATAAAALHPLVFQYAESDRERSYPDARAAQALGQMYAAGLGVTRDSVVACALFGLATGSAVYQHGDEHALTDAARRLLDDQCVKLTAEERKEAAKLAECPSMRAGTQTFTLGTAHRVELHRGVVRVHHKNGRRDHWLGDLVDCAPVVPAVRHTAVKPRRGSKLPVRHFLEVLAWRARPGGDGRTVHVLEWRAVEIRGTDLAIAARTTLDTADSMSAADPPPAGAGLVSMRMLGNGQVRWQTAQDPRASGIITRPTSGTRAVRRPKQE